jgi:hypothetical protein
MSETKRDGAVDLLERQNRKGLRKAFGRLAGEEPVHDGVERHARISHEAAAIALFDVGRVHETS